MRLLTFTQADARKWNEIILSSQSGTLFHTWEWLKIVEKYTQSKLLPLAFFDTDDDKPFGAMPLFSMKKLGLKMIFSPPPGASITLGPTLLKKGYDEDKFILAYQNFQRSIDNYIKKTGANYINIATSPGLLDVRPFLWAGYQIKPSYTYITDLNQGENILWSNLSSSLRSAINKTRNRGVQIMKNNLDVHQITDYIHNSLTECYQKQNLGLPLNKVYLQDILEQFSNSGVKVSIAKKDDEIQGAQIYCTYRDTISLWLGLVRPASNDLEINGLMIWDTIIDSIKEGYRWLENMGANTPHLCGYKSKFCPTVELCFEIKKADLLGSLAERAYFLRKGKSTKERNMQSSDISFSE